MALLQLLLNLLLNLLQDQYQNITVTAENDLEATLRQAVSENDTLAEIDAALQAELLPTVAFESLQSAQAGDQTFDLVFKAGSDTQAMARQTYTDWNTVFGSLPSGGQYLAGLATVEADNGYYILVNVTVKKGASSGSDDSDEDETKPETPKDPLLVEGVTSSKKGTYTVTTQAGLTNLFEKVKGDPTALRGKTIQLQSDVEYTLTARLADTFEGTLTSESGTATVTLSGASLFGTIAEGAKVQGINFEVTQDIGGDEANNGVVATENNGEIFNCEVMINENTMMTSDGNAGGIVGVNNGSITGGIVVFKGGVHIAGQNYVGGIAGINGENGSIHSCKVQVDDNNSSITGIEAGVLVGYNQNSADKVDGSFEGLSLKVNTANANPADYNVENLFIGKQEQAAEAEG